MMELGKTYNMCCVEGLKQLGPDTVDLMVTSPPYDDLRTYDDYDAWNFDKFKLIAHAMTDALKPGGIIVWIVGDAVIDRSETGSSFRQALYFKDECGLLLHDTMIFQKKGARPSADKRYLQAFEYMFVLTKGPPKTGNMLKDRPNKTAGRIIDKLQYRTTGGKNSVHTTNQHGKPVPEFGCRYNVWEIAQTSGQPREAYQHPATFSGNLARDHILSWSNPDDLVCDPFAGSGTTCRMAKLTGRKFIGFEINPEYAELSNRLADKIVV